MMDLYLPLRRGTLLIPSGPPDDPERKHLFVILTDPVVDENDGTQRVLLVSISSVRSRYDDSTCILRRGDHPFIRHESFVDYREARIELVDALRRGVQNGVLVPQESIETSVFSRICTGLQNSPHTAPRFLKFFWEADQ